MPSRALSNPWYQLLYGAAAQSKLQVLHTSLHTSSHKVLACKPLIIRLDVTQCRKYATAVTQI